MQLQEIGRDTQQLKETVYVETPPYERSPSERSVADIEAEVERRCWQTVRSKL